MTTVIVAMALVLLPAPSAGAQATAATAWVVADADTGRVIDSGNSRTPLPPASLTKVITALTVVRALPPGTTVPVTRRAAAMPASRIGMKPGTRWRLDDVMAALLLSSANDAAMALAERVSGSAEAFSAAMQATATQLGMRDGPVLRDPAGLDGAAGVGGGNLVSAEDLALAARAALAEPRLAPLLALREYRFTGPDGKHRRLVNHNKLLWSYPGAVGVKTGYTRLAGRCLSAAARRDGRTVLAVVLQASDVYPTTAGLLDAGFAAPAPSRTAGSPSAGPALPGLPLLPALPLPLLSPPPPLPTPPSLPAPVAPPALPLPSAPALASAAAP